MDFFYKYKKIFFILLFLLFSAFLGFIMFSLFFGSSPITGPEDPQKPGGSGGLPTAGDGDGQIVSPGTGSGELPTTKDPEPIPSGAFNQTGDGGLTKTTTLISAQTSNQSINKDGSSINYYNQEDGKFYKIDENGKQVTLSDKVFYSVETVSWANENDKAIIEYPDGANIVYDFETEQQVTLPKHWEDFDFSSNDKQIVSKSIGLDEQNRWLTVSNADGSNSKKIEALGSNADRVYSSWSPNNQTIAMYAKGEGLDKQTLYFFGQNHENFKAASIEGRGFQPLWSPDGSTLLYSVYSSNTDLKPTLWVVAAQGDSIGADRRSLGITTWAEKCSFAGAATVYCAVPQDMPEGAGLFKDLAQNTSDVIYKINIFTGVKRIVSIPDTAYSISNIIISEDEKTLFFSDSLSNAIHKINL